MSTRTTSGTRLHRPARALVERLSAGPDLLYLFWPTILAYLRITTNPRSSGTDRPADRATENIDGLLRLPHVVSPGGGQAVLGHVSRRQEVRLARGNMVPDTHLATLMREHGVRILYTRDRGFRRFDFLDVRDPFSHAVNERAT